MQFQISARRWRPQTFEEVLGQEQLVQILAQAVLQEKTAQAYLFTGMRGVGKTTVARVLAKAINCTDAQKRPCNVCASCVEITEDRSVDVLQIDGASNTSVDNVRELREMVKYRPIRGKYKVIIIDETHMLSNAAWNALLKTLEEPPPHLVFIFATTEAHKIPATIISRCQQFIFRRITRNEIEAHLKKVAQTLGTPLSDPVVTFIAKASEGSLRDALSLFDQVVAYGGHAITEETLATLFGRVTGAILHRFLEGIHEKNTEALLNLARQIENGGYDLRQFLLDWVEYLRHILVTQQVAHADPLLDLPDEEKQEIKRAASLFSKEAIHRIFTLFVKLQEEIKNAPRPHILFEVALMKTVLLADLTTIEKILEQIQTFPGHEQTGRPTPPLLASAAVNEKSPLNVPSPATSAIRHGLMSDKESAYSSHSNRSIEPVIRTDQSSPPTETVSFQRPLQETVKQSPVTAPGLDGNTIGEAPSAQKEKDAWSALLQEVKAKRPSLASCLEQGEGVDIHETTITIGFPQENAFSISVIQSEENKVWLADLAKRYFNRAMRILCVRRNDSSVHPVTAGFNQHPLVQEVLNIFDGAIIKGGK